MEEWRLFDLMLAWGAIGVITGLVISNVQNIGVILGIGVAASFVGAWMDVGKRNRVSKQVLKECGVSDGAWTLFKDNEKGVATKTIFLRGEKTSD
jgi:hypothetical protein